jgi:hypothetical protein
MYIQIILIIVIIYLLFFKDKKESFYDVTPYNIVWDIDKCLTGSCVMDKSYKCYKYCDYIQDTPAKEHCQIECLNIGDEMFDYLKYQNYNFPLEKVNKFFKKYTILNDTNDYVNMSLK